MTRDDILGLIEAAAARYGVPREFLEATIEQESGFRSDAVSPAGASGLAQLMPSSVNALSERLGRQIDPFNPVDAIESASYLWAENLGIFGGDPLKAAAAYQAGPNAVLEAQTPDGLPDTSDGLMATRDYAHGIVRRARGLSVGSTEPLSIAIPDFSSLPETMKLRLGDAIKGMADAGASEDEIAKFLTANEGEIREGSYNAVLNELPLIARAPGMIAEFLGSMLEPSVANIAALPASFTTGPLVGKIAARFLPAHGIKRLVVKFATQAPVEEWAATEFNRSLLAGSAAVKSIIEEPGFALRMARGFGVALPFSTAHAIDSMNDTSDSTPQGAFVSTLGFFMGFELLLAGGGVVGRSLSRVLGRRVANLVDFEGLAAREAAERAARDAVSPEAAFVDQWVADATRKPTETETTATALDEQQARGFAVLKRLGFRSPWARGESQFELKLTPAGSKLSKQELEDATAYMKARSDHAHQVRESGFPEEIVGTPEEREAAVAAARRQRGALVGPLPRPIVPPAPGRETPGARPPTFSGGRPAADVRAEAEAARGAEVARPMLAAPRIETTVIIDASGTKATLEPPKVTRVVKGAIPQRVRRFLRRLMDRDLTDAELLAVADGRAPEIVEAVETGKIILKPASVDKQGNPVPEQAVPATKSTLEKFLSQAIKKKRPVSGTQQTLDTGLGTGAIGISGVGRATKQAVESLSPPERKTIARVATIADLSEVIDTKGSPVQRELRDAVLEGAGIPPPDQVASSVAGMPAPPGTLQSGASDLAAIVTGSRVPLLAPASARGDTALIEELSIRAAASKETRDAVRRKELDAANDAITSLEETAGKIEAKLAAATPDKKGKYETQLASVRASAAAKRRIIKDHQGALAEADPAPVAVRRDKALESTLAPETRTRIERQAPEAHLGMIVIPQDAQSGVTYVILRQNIVRRGRGRGKPILEGRAEIGYVYENPESHERTILFHGHVTADGSGGGEKLNIPGYKPTGKYASTNENLDVVGVDDPRAADQLVRLYEGSMIRNYSHALGEPIPKAITHLPFVDRILHHATRFSSRRTEVALGLAAKAPTHRVVQVDDLEAVAAAAAKKGGRAPQAGGESVTPLDTLLEKEAVGAAEKKAASAPLNLDHILAAQPAALAKLPIDDLRRMRNHPRLLGALRQGSPELVASRKLDSAMDAAEKRFEPAVKDAAKLFASEGIMADEAMFTGLLAKHKIKATPGEIADQVAAMRREAGEFAGGPSVTDLEDEASREVAAQVMNAHALTGDAAVMAEANMPAPPALKTPSAEAAMRIVQTTYEVLARSMPKVKDPAQLDTLQTAFMDALDELKTHASRKGLVFEFIAGKPNDRTGVVDQAIRIYEERPGGFDQTWPSELADKAAIAIDEFSPNSPSLKRGGGRVGQYPKDGCS